MEVCVPAVFISLQIKTMHVTKLLHTAGLCLL